MRRYQYETSHLVEDPTQGARFLVEENGQTLALGLVPVQLFLPQAELEPLIAARDLRVAGQLEADQAQQVELNE